MGRSAAVSLASSQATLGSNQKHQSLRTYLKCRNPKAEVARNGSRALFGIEFDRSQNRRRLTAICAKRSWSESRMMNTLNRAACFTAVLAGFLTLASADRHAVEGCRSIEGRRFGRYRRPF